MGTLSRLWAFFTGKKEEAPPAVQPLPAPVSEAPKKPKKPRKPRKPKKAEVTAEPVCEKPKKPRKPRKPRKPKPACSDPCNSECGCTKPEEPQLAEDEKSDYIEVTHTTESANTASE